MSPPCSHWRRVLPVTPRNMTVNDAASGIPLAECHISHHDATCPPLVETPLREKAARHTKDRTTKPQVQEQRPVYNRPASYMHDAVAYERGPKS
jgi:hypothetical protein